MPAVLFLARVELGGQPKVFPVSGESLRVPDYNKPRARVIPRKPKAWMFNAERTSLGRHLCPPGAAAIDTTEAAAIAAALTLLAKYEAARKRR